MKSQSQNPEFRNNPVNFRPCLYLPNPNMPLCPIESNFRFLSALFCMSDIARLIADRSNSPKPEES